MAAVIELNFLADEFQHCSGGSFTVLIVKNKSFGVFVEDLVRRLLTAHLVLWICAGDHAVKSAETAFFASTLLPRRYFQNRRGENREYPPRFLV